MVDLTKYVNLTLGHDVTIDEIKEATGRSEVRVALPDTPLTKDINHDRVTVFVTYEYVITEVHLD